MALIDRVRVMADQDSYWSTAHVVQSVGKLGLYSGHPNLIYMRSIVQYLLFPPGSETLHGLMNVFLTKTVNTLDHNVIWRVCKNSFVCGCCTTLLPSKFRGCSEYLVFSIREIHDAKILLQRTADRGDWGIQ